MCSLRVIVSVSVLLGLNVTSHFFAQVCIELISVFKHSAAISGVSTIMYKLVSFAKSFIVELMSLTMSFMGRTYW